MTPIAGFILSGKHGIVREFKVIWKSQGNKQKKQYFNVFLANYKFQYYTQKKKLTHFELSGRF
jgi:hypothetical protein